MKRPFVFLITLLSIFLISTFPLEAQEEENQRLYYLCQVWGYYKYFHPSLGSCNGPDWDAALIQAIEGTKDASNNFAFNLVLERLENFVSPIPPAENPPPDLENRLTDNLDLSWLDDEIFAQNIKSNLLNIKENYRPVDHCGVKWEGQGGLRFPGEKPYSSMTYPNEAYRLLALFRFWNVIRYFYPYSNNLKKTWEETLLEFIPRMKAVQNSTAYQLEMMSLFKEIEDGYLKVLSPAFDSYLGFYYAPLEFSYVENKTVVQSVLDNSLEIQIGDVVTHINGEEVESIRDSLREYAWGREGGGAELRINNWLVRGQQGSFEITVENEEGTKNYTLDRPFDIAAYEKALPLNAEGHVGRLAQRLPGNYGYINVSRLETNRISQTIFNLKQREPKPPAIILDLRETEFEFFPSLAQHFMRSSEVYSLQTLADIRFPGTAPLPLQKTIGINRDQPGELVILIIDESTIGAGEMTALALEAYNNVRKVGSPTAGSVGEELSLLWLPGGISILFNVLNVSYPDGTLIHSVGIQPDVEVRPMIEDIRKGIDPLIEAAIQEAKLQVDISEVLVFPNPSQNELNLMFPYGDGNEVQIDIYDTKGRNIKSFERINQRSIIHLDISDLQRGYYFVRILNGERASMAKFEKI